MDITKIPIIQITQGTSIIEINPQSDVGIASGTLKLDRIIVNNELKFGELYSDKFEVEIYNIEDDLSGCPIQLFIEEDNVRTVKFTGVIESSKRDRIGYSRKIIAYDWVHYHRDDNISSWWNSFWTTSRLSATIKEIRDSLISYMGFTGDSNTYVNDSITIPNNFNLYTDLKFHTIISMLCELQGTLPHIAEDGSFKFITINNTTEDITGDYEGGNCTWEDYTTNAITGVGIYSTSDDLSQLIGTNANVYRVAGNLFALTLNASDLTTLGTNLLSAISTIQFVPNTIKMKITNFDLALGQRYNTEHGYGYVMSNAISGICMVEQTLKSVAMGENLSETVSTRNDTMIEGAKMSKFEQTIDGFQTEVSQATQTANTALSRANGSITTDTLHYLATPLSSGVTTETAGWTTTPQSMTPTNKYLWTYHTYTYADAHTSDTTPVITGVYGEDGQQGQPGTSVTITSQTVTYQASTSGTVTPTGTWQTSVPSVSQGEYLWTRTIVNYSNGTSTTSYSVSYQGQNGANGTNGTSVTVSSIQYASSTSGTTAPTSGWQNTIPTVSQGSYLWTKTTYSNGSVAYTNSRQGVNGTNGTNGTSVTITSQSVTYQVGSSGTTAPTGTWQSTPQATTTGQFLWTRTIVNYSNGTSTTSYSVSAHGSTGSQGATGIGISEVTPLYYVSNSSTVPSAPTSQVTTTTTTSYNTWTKGIPAMTTTYKYMFTCDQVKYTNNTFTWTTPVLNSAITTAVSEIQQLAGQIVLKVDNNGNIVKVELSANPSTGTEFKVSADNIDFMANGVMNFSANQIGITASNFSVDKTTGNMTCTGGTIGGFTIDSTSIYNNELKISSADFIKTINDLNRYGLRFSIGDEFAINKFGVVYGRSFYCDATVENVSYNSLFSYSHLWLQDATNDKSVNIHADTIYVASYHGSNPKLVDNIEITATGITKTVNSNTTYTYLHTGNIGFSNSSNGEHNANNMTTNGLYYYTSNGPATSLGASTTDGAMYVQACSANWVAQIAQDYRNGTLFVRGKNNGTWQAWKKILDSTNGILRDSDNGSAAIYWKENGYGDKFRIVPQFSGFDDSNYLRFQGAVGGAGTDPSLYDLMYITGKSGNMWLKGSLSIATAQRITYGTACSIESLGSNNTVCICGNAYAQVRRYDNRNTNQGIYASAFTVSSSKLIKENVKNLSEEEAKKLLDVRVVDFDYIKKVGGEKGQHGVIAEEVMDIIPFVVSIPENYNEEEEKQKIKSDSDEMINVLGVDYAKFTPYLIKMIQMQQKQINELKRRIEE